MQTWQGVYHRLLGYYKKGLQLQKGWEQILYTHYVAIKTAVLSGIINFNFF